MRNHRAGNVRDLQVFCAQTFRKPMGLFTQFNGHFIQGYEDMAGYRYFQAGAL